MLKVFSEHEVQTGRLNQSMWILRGRGLCDGSLHAERASPNQLTCDRFVMNVCFALRFDGSRFSVKMKVLQVPN